MDEKDQKKMEKKDGMSLFNSQLVMESWTERQWRGCGEDSLFRQPSEKQVPCPVGHRVCLNTCVVLHHSPLTMNILNS